MYVSVFAVELRTFCRQRWLATGSKRVALLSAPAIVALKQLFVWRSVDRLNGYTASFSRPPFPAPPSSSSNLISSHLAIDDGGGYNRLPACAVRPAAEPRILISGICSRTACKKNAWPRSFVRSCTCHVCRQLEISLAGNFRFDCGTHLHDSPRALPVSRPARRGGLVATNGWTDGLCCPCSPMRLSRAKCLTAYGQTAPAGPSAFTVSR